ncbi:Piso0_000035 [Millerozyma farinosa CBS 7064]|uniref:Piso0_000035 protein n=1 Tax=Pichia sorbitophila (strain ATCC MYA-4447 / BCRC 22081 / CBS 7064 / NBRC 10061 / NRRL Y-12695) TaxID=559304 RepID=G8YSX4_PICSO|nr:Piso0_000035 [Millerozyma farinosa CBS 7064]
MPVPFPDLDPYEVLGLDSGADPIEIKKAYKKLSLKYHPDKIQQSSSSNDVDHFPKIQFAYSVLSDSSKRQRYDATKSLDVIDDYDNDFFDWKEYFDSMNERITIDMIEQDKEKYQYSSEEREDIIQNFLFYEGDFLKLFEVIPHLEFDEVQEDRIYHIIEDAIKDNRVNPENDAGALRLWEKYKKTRKTKVQNMLKKLAREAKQAEALEKQIKDKEKRKLNNENDLKSLIQSRQSNRLDDLINKLESKYGDSKGKKRASKDISDEEFSRIQKKLKNPTNSKKN